MEILTFFKGEWQTISQAPFTFATGAILISGLAFLILRAFFEGRISTLEGRISLKDDQLADYKNKLSGATPDEAKQRLEKLEQQVVALSPRRLNDDNVRKLVSVLSESPATIEISQDMAAADARALAGDFIITFQRANWRISAPMVMGIGNPPPTGIALQVQNVRDLRPSELLVKRALENAGIDFDLQPNLHRPPTRPPMPEGLAPIPEEIGPDVGILVTTRLI